MNALWLLVVSEFGLRLVRHLVRVSRQTMCERAAGHCWPLVHWGQRPPGRE